MDQRLILDSEVLDFVFPFGKFNGDSVPFIFDSFLFGQQDISMHKNFLLPFLHTHLQLIFLVFEAVYVISSSVQIFFDLLDFQFHDVMLNKNLFFFLVDLGEILNGHVVLKGKFFNLRVQLFL